MRRLSSRNTGRRSGASSRGAYYFGIGENNYDWTSPQNDALWRDGIKTLFDPCPAGWRVPRSGEGEWSPWQALTLDNSTWTGNEIDPLAGRMWNTLPVYGGTVWYTPSGARISEFQGDLTWVGKDCHVATASLYSGTMVHRFYTTKISVDQAGFYVRGRGYSVRCVRE